MKNDPLRFVSVPVRRLLFFAALGFIAFVSLWSHDNLEEHVPKEIQSRDFLIHLGCYLVLCACCLWSFGRRAAPTGSRVAAALFCAGYGLLMEFLQLLPAVGRSCSLHDMRQNLIGAVLGAVLVPRFLWPDASSASCTGCAAGSGSPRWRP